MRIDLEQFLAVTMILGTAGAVGLAVVVTQRDDADAEQALEEAAEVDDAAPEVVASPSPPPAAAPAAPVVTPEPEGPPPLPAEPDADFLRDPALDGMPAPHVEGFG